MTQGADDWRGDLGSGRYTIEAGIAAGTAWYRRPIVIMALAGAIVAAAAAIFIGGSGPGVDPTTTGTVEVDDHLGDLGDIADEAQFLSL